MSKKLSNTTEKKPTTKVYPDLVLPDGKTFGELLKKTFENNPPKKDKSPKNKEKKRPG